MLNSKSLEWATEVTEVSQESQGAEHGGVFDFGEEIESQSSECQRVPYSSMTFLVLQISELLRTYS